ncbi:hypothetical protein GDO78_010311 [Eleutherodactylus coqui]|uniref:EF-hand domain-containing protein n=1 Tax=Eleutherodactylus coqui TaxID=57060 RepID=A0A8J6F5R2_ELECQ|nr:hypothetical protein GDO78_010311 [Eleutherodactylus coqui]
MGSRASTLLRDEEIEEIKKETGFSHSQITRLYSRFTSLDKGENGTLSREDFQRIPELAINPLGDRIINAFFIEGVHVLRMMVGVNISDEQLGSIADRTIQEADQDGDSAISFSEFVKVLEKVDVEQKMSIRFLH